MYPLTIVIYLFIGMRHIIIKFKNCSMHCFIKLHHSKTFWGIPWLIWVDKPKPMTLKKEANYELTNIFRFNIHMNTKIITLSLLLHRYINETRFASTLAINTLLMYMLIAKPLLKGVTSYLPASSHIVSNVGLRVGDPKCCRESENI